MKKTTAKTQALLDMKSEGINIKVLNYKEINPCCSGKGCNICK